MGGRQARTFTEMVLQEDDDLDMARAALAIASEEYPGLDGDRYLAELDLLARRVRERAGPRVDARGRVAAMNHVLFTQLEFKGNLEDYYNPENSHLNRVMDRKLGIPITLGILYLEVGRRVGLPMVGVGLPGHFLVKVADADQELLLDPFYQGVEMDRAACQRRLDAIYGGKVRLQDSYLHPVSKRDILARVLYNLKRVYTRVGDTDHALPVLDNLLALQPYAFEDLRDRGMMLFRKGRYRDALQDLRAYASYLPAAKDIGRVRRTIEACERMSPTSA